jgi:hypothetical protein
MGYHLGHTRDDERWLDSNRWSIWTRGVGLDTHTEKREPYIIGPVAKDDVPDILKGGTDKPIK